MAKSGALDALIDFAGAMLPLRARNLQTVIDENLSQIPNELNEYGYDAYGMSPFWMRRVLMPFALLYRYYFRVEVAGIENLPEGRVIVIANHAGQLPFDAAMLSPRAPGHWLERRRIASTCWKTASACSRFRRVFAG